MVFRQIKYYASQITTVLVSPNSAVVSVKENQNQIKQRNKQADPFLTNCFFRLLVYRI